MNLQPPQLLAQNAKVGCVAGWIAVCNENGALSALPPFAGKNLLQFECLH
jgi:hypothetical protein